MALTKEQLDQILANQNPDFWGNGMGSPTVIDGMQYTPQYSGGPISRETGGGDGYQLQSITAAENGPWYQGKMATTYSPTGEVQQRFQVEDPNSSDLGEKLVKAGLATLMGYAGGQALGMFGGAGGVGSAAGDAFLPGALGVDGAAMSTAPLSGLEGYLAGGAAGGATSAAGDMFMPGQLGANYTPGAIPGLEKYATSGIGSAVKGLLPDSAKGWLGPAAILAGGLLGSKPQTQSATSTRTTDPRFDPAINGLLGMLQQQINQPRPTNTLGNIAPRGNGFGLFTGR